MRKSLIDALFSKIRQAVLSACILHPDKWWYLSDLAKHLGVTPSSLQRELASFASAQLLESRKDGNRVYYKANLSAPGLAELQSLFIKTIGLTDILRNSLKSYLQRAEVIFIYGSLARAEEVATSDVDLMIIGDIKLSEIAGVLRKSEKTLGRDVNATVYTTKEFAQKLKQGDSFIRTVLREEKIFLKGSLVELEALDRTRTSSRS